nr:MAG: replication initiator protein [Microvirus sp.]
MPCYGPLTAYYSKELNPTGKRSLIFDRRASHSGVAVKLPCGQCIGCRLERSRQWAMRCMHEKRVCNAESSFVTLTYDNKNMPSECSLSVRDLQLFMKRLRKRTGDGVRFYACGEYGETTFRPHYHILLFNRDFSDKKFYKNAGCGEKLWNSSTLDELWPFGFNVIGDVTFDSCAYVARYIVKKITGDKAEAHYGGRLPEFTVMSRRPGIGFSWYEKYGEHAYALDSVVMNGKEIRPPRYYDTKYELVDSDQLALLKKKRLRAAIDATRGETNRRRVTKEEFERQKLTLKQRSV